MHWSGQCVNGSVFWTSLALLAGLVFAEAPPAGAMDVTWGALVDPEAQVYEDPFSELEPGALEALISIIRLRARRAALSEGDESRVSVEAEIADKETALREMGVDADLLISQRWVVAERREHAATAGNADLDGETVTLAGFAIPAPPSADGGVTAYLVPEPGMCSHMPPPAPNRMVRLRLLPGQEPFPIYQPVVVTGPLAISPSARQMLVVDGFVPMRATYAMDVQAVQMVGNKPDTSPPQYGPWARALAERFGGRGASAVTESPNSP